MLRLAHISDPHLGPMPGLRAGDYFNKRVIGFLYWKSNRKRHMTDDWRNRLIEDLQGFNPGHIAVTGDVTNLALEDEFHRGREWLESLGAAEDVSVIPGNHDAYVRGAFRRSAETWAPFMIGDAAPSDKITFPYVRRRNGIALIGTSSGVAMPPFVAAGLFGAAQARRLKAILSDPALENDFKIVMIHHPPHAGATIALSALYGAARFRRVIESAGADLVLHGHTHLATVATIPGPRAPVPVIGVPAASNGTGARRPAARFNLFDIERAGDTRWTCHWTERGFDRETGELSTFRDRVSIASLMPRVRSEDWTRPAPSVSPSAPQPAVIPQKEL